MVGPGNIYALIRRVGRGQEKVFLGRGWGTHDPDPPHYHYYNQIFLCVCVCVLSHICPGSREVMLSEFAAGWLSVQLCFLYRYEHQCKYGYSLLGSLHIRWQWHLRPWSYQSDFNYQSSFLFFGFSLILGSQKYLSMLKSISIVSICWLTLLIRKDFSSTSHQLFVVEISTAEILKKFVICAVCHDLIET